MSSHIVEVGNISTGAANAPAPANEPASVVVAIGDLPPTPDTQVTDRQQQTRDVPAHDAEIVNAAAQKIQALVRGYCQRAKAKQQVLDQIQRRGLSSLPAYKVSILLRHHKEAKPFLACLHKRKVTGAILQCMTDPEDVLEYVDAAVKNFHVRRLLKWLARIGEGRARRLSVLDSPDIRRLSTKAFEALSAQEIEQLLSSVGLQRVLPSFQKNSIDGADLRDMEMQDIAEIATRATSAERKLLLRIIHDIQVPLGASLQSLPQENEGLLRQLNAWFPGKFRAAIGTPLYGHDETTLVQATHKTAGEVVVKVVLTTDKDRFKRSKREMNLLEVFHENKYVCSIISGVAKDATPGIPALCACILPYHKLGTVQTLLKNGNPEFTTKSNGISCLLLKHAVDMAKDILAALECMHQRKIVHRDIKPDNICIKMLPSEDEVRLQYIVIDLGAAVAIKTSRESGSETSSECASNSANKLVAFTGQFTSMAGQKLPLGTVSFMSPEHIDPTRLVDGRTDVFSLGVTMFVCLCGRFPFVQPSSCPDMKFLGVRMLQRFCMSREADTLKIADTGAQERTAEEVVAIVAKSLLRDRDERYANADAMKKDVERIDGLWR